MARAPVVVEQESNIDPAHIPLLKRLCALPDSSIHAATGIGSRSKPGRERPVGSRFFHNGWGFPQIRLSVTDNQNPVLSPR